MVCGSWGYQRVGVQLTCRSTTLLTFFALRTVFPRNRLLYLPSSQHAYYSQESQLILSLESQGKMFSFFRDHRTDRYKVWDGWGGASSSHGRKGPKGRENSDQGQGGGLGQQPEPLGLWSPGASNPGVSRYATLITICRLIVCKSVDL